MRMTTILCCLLLAPCILSQNPPQSKEEVLARLIALEKMWNQAQLTRDARALDSLVGERFVNTEWDGQLSRKDKFLADIRDPEFKPTMMNTQDVSVELYGETAIVVGVYHARGSYKGKSYEHEGRFTDTWIRQGKLWVCVASHTSLLPK